MQRFIESVDVSFLVTFYSKVVFERRDCGWKTRFVGTSPKLAFRKTLLLFVKTRRLLVENVTNIFLLKSYFTILR